MSNQNNITELRAILFDTVRGLKDGTVKREDAKAIQEVAQVIINSAKVEVDHQRHTGLRTTSFLSEKPEAAALTDQSTSYIHRSGERSKRQLHGVPVIEHDDD